MIRVVQLPDVVETKKQLQDTKQRINNWRTKIHNTENLSTGSPDSDPVDTRAAEIALDRQTHGQHVNSSKSHSLSLPGRHWATGDTKQETARRKVEKKRGGTIQPDMTRDNRATKIQNHCCSSSSSDGCRQARQDTRLQTTSRDKVLSRILKYISKVCQKLKSNNIHYSGISNPSPFQDATMCQCWSRGADFGPTCASKRYPDWS